MPAVSGREFGAILPFFGAWNEINPAPQPRRWSSRFRGEKTPQTGDGRMNRRVT